MLNFGILENGPHFVIFQKKWLLCYSLLTDQISFPDCFYFLIYCLIKYCNCLLTWLWRHEFQN